MAQESQQKIMPPGQERPYPKPSSSGKISFSYPKNSMKGETAYWIWGDITKATPLICLHGGPGAPHDYILLISLIHSDFSIPVVMYDQIGCGESTRFPEKKGDSDYWTVQLFMDELDNVRRQLGIDTFHLYGHSWGGMLAAQYAIERQPGGLQKLVISDAPSDIPTWLAVTNRLRKQMPPEVQEVLDRCEREGKTESEEYQQAVLEFYARHVCRLEPLPKEWMYCLEQLEQDNTVYYTMFGPSEFYATGNLKDWSIIEELPRITEKTCPGGLLLMNGAYDEAQDECVRPFFTRTRCRGKWVRYALGSHMIMLEETEKYIADIGAFLTIE